jgi:Heterokaryon incompatibility protein (HET)
MSVRFFRYCTSHQTTKLITYYSAEIMATETPALSYSPLNEGEIRLISFVNATDQAEDTISCRLEHVRLDQNPVFYALSYVWGDGTARRPLLVNGCSFLATQNLHDALLQIRQHAPKFLQIIQRDSGIDTPIFRLWVDALCINQEDMVEKSSQVPRMKDVYARAYNVLAWLGTVEQVDMGDLAYPVFLQEAFKVKKVDPLFEPTTTELSALFKRRGVPESPESHLLLCISIAWKIFNMPWGSRVWVIQEYVLSKRTPWALLDSGVFALDFTKAISSQTLPQLTEGPKDSLRDILNPILASFPAIGDPLMRFIDLRDKLQFENFWDKSLADQLLHLLLYKCGSRCAIAHDHIYGILSLVDVNLLPEQLRPDYSEPFETVYFKYMRYIVENTHSLALLDISVGFPPRGCPTWVPDFGYQIQDIHLDPLTRNEISCTTDGRVLEVEGVKLSRVLRYARKFDDNHEQMVHFDRDILRASADIRAVPYRDVWRGYLQPWAQLFNVSIPYASWDEFLGISSLFQQGKHDGISHYEKAILHGGTDIFGHRAVYALLDSGDIVQCWQPDLGVGLGEYFMWALKGMAKYAILSPGEGGHWYQGSCLPWPRSLRSSISDLDKSFFDGKKVERIHLI